MSDASEVSKLGTVYALESGAVLGGKSYYWLEMCTSAYNRVMDLAVEDLPRHLTDGNIWVSSFSRARLELGV